MGRSACAGRVGRLAMEDHVGSDPPPQNAVLLRLGEGFGKVTKFVVTLRGATSRGPGRPPLPWQTAINHALNGQPIGASQNPRDLGDPERRPLRGLYPRPTHGRGHVVAEMRILRCICLLGWLFWVFGPKRQEPRSVSALYRRP